MISKFCLAGNGWWDDNDDDDDLIDSADPPSPPLHLSPHLSPAGPWKPSMPLITILSRLQSQGSCWWLQGGWVPWQHSALCLSAWLELGTSKPWMLQHQYKPLISLKQQDRVGEIKEELQEEHWETFFSKNGLLLLPILVGFFIGLVSFSSSVETSARRLVNGGNIRCSATSLSRLSTLRMTSVLRTPILLFCCTFSPL